jgi:hypothetical protein
VGAVGLLTRSRLAMEAEFRVMAAVLAELDGRGVDVAVAPTYGQLGAPAGAVGNVYTNAHDHLSDNGIVVSIALQNHVDQNTDGIKNGRADANPKFSGEITATMCASTVWSAARPPAPTPRATSL